MTRAVPRGLFPAMVAPVVVVAAAIMYQAPPTIMPTRRPEWQAGFDLNDLLPDAGKHAERKSRKADRRAKLNALQRAALEE